MIETFPSVPINKPETFSRDEKIFLNNKLHEMNEGALLEEDFAIFTGKDGKEYGLYTEDQIKKDKEYIQGIKRSFEISKKTRELESSNYIHQEKIIETSQYLEALFYEKLGGKDGWLPESTVYKTSEYDDYINHIDFVVELGVEEFGVAVDVTLSGTPEIIIKKLNKTKQLIDRNVLTEVKYYQRREDSKSATVPLAVIALDYDHAVQALKFWADGDDELLSRHPTRVKAWLEVSAQFDANRAYAERLKKHDIARAYQHGYEVIQKIIIENKDIVDKYRNLIEKDQAYQIIIGFCDDLKMVG